MNDICKNCDTRIRLGLCNGREGDFQYCYRKVGSVNGLEDTITPFNTIDDLYENCEHLKGTIKEQTYLDNKPYANDEHMVLLYGLYKGEPDLEEKIERGFVYPIGYVTR